MQDDDGIEHGQDEAIQATQEVLNNFFIKCEGRAKPVIVRSDYILAVDAAGCFDSLPDIYQLAIQYTEQWLDIFEGHEHKFNCACCHSHVHCASEKGHEEVGAFLCVFKHDLDLDVGGLVMALCHDCAEKTDREIYTKFVENLGGESSDLAFKDDPRHPDHVPADPAPATSQDDINLLLGND